MKQKVLEYELPIKIKPEKGGFVAVCPIWSDCYAQADSIDEAILEITAVTQALIELYKEENMKIPLKLATKKTIVLDNFSIPIITAA